MALTGSDGISRKEFFKVLNLPVSHDSEALLAKVGEFLSRLSKDKSDKSIILANGLFLDSGVNVQTKFSMALQKYFQSEVMRVNFGGNPEEARADVNKWVSDKTMKKIVELLPKGTVDNLTKLVLANAVYFKGTWKKAFSPDLTSPMPFNLNKKTKVDVPTMRTVGMFDAGWFEEFSADALRIPFKTHEMIIVIPSTPDGLPKLVSDLFQNDQKNFNLIFDPARYYNGIMELRLPKFKISGGKSIDLKASLKNLGLESAFVDGEADFSRINNKLDLYITSIVHKAAIEINEEGAEAAGSTGATIGIKSLFRTFSVDRPFLFFIMTDTGIPAFMGHVVNPLEN